MANEGFVGRLVSSMASRPAFTQGRRMRFLKSSLWGQLGLGFVLGALGLLAFQSGEGARAFAHHFASIVHHRA
jgi:hypothetical protein